MRDFKLMRIDCMEQFELHARIAFTTLFHIFHWLGQFLGRMIGQ